ncbi:transglutaminase domain-containing protein [Streptomyces sp. NPDC088350]|uniref:transglutaminase domain-containing protein n=1 Tax=Streptomyces sp. NPDC088350 TaxID=3365854 RepID=UPI00380ECE85
MNDELIDILLGAGFPSEGRGKGVIFDPLDLENVGLDLRLPSASRAATSLWARSFRRPSRLATANCSVQMSWSCPTPGHDGDCDFAISPRIGDQAEAAVNNGRSTWQTSLEVQLLNDEYLFRGEFSVLVQESQRLHFHRLTPELAEDMEFLREHRIADCLSASIYLAEVAAELGLVVRQASGYFVGAPFLVPHTWLEVNVNGRWIAADPYFLQTLGRWGVVDAESWPPDRSPRNVLWRVRSDLNKEQLVKHGAMDTPVQLIARMSYDADTVDRES